MKGLVFIESKGQDIKRGSLEALSGIQGDGHSIAACAIGPGVDQLSEKLGAWGVSQFFCCTDEKAHQYNPEVYQNFLAQVIEKVQPQLVVASSNNVGQDIFPRLAAKFDMAYMSDITEMTTGDKAVVKRPLYAGKCSTQVTFTDDSARILLLRPNQIPILSPQGATQVEMIQIQVENGPGLSETLSIEQGESEKLDLTEAEIIVSGGRGLKEAQNFKLLEELAKPLGATVGASRAVVDLGWVPHSLQVGQTGKTVAPKLYFAVGISGAIQHLAGMSGSKNIVAINQDEKAPIFQKATYGIVGDLFEVVPKLTEELQSLQK